MVPDRLREIIDSAMDHRVIRPNFEPSTMLHDIEVDGLERAEIAMALEDLLRCDVSDREHESWQTISDIIRCYQAGGGD